ncbi:MAG: hydroxymethylbilane synthase [Alphaproteobacteria bacterium]|nr:hydroxymethylbilane synthase [Alphaproteobacteria bacterium]
MVKSIKLGTRGSPLALRQTEMVRAALAKAWPDMETEVVVIKTSGDWDPQQGETRLSESEGGKGQFAKEIEEALLAGRIDAGVHSMKDMESHLPAGLAIECMLEREDVRDVILFKGLANSTRKLEDLPRDFIIGTSSVRRAAFLKNRRPDLTIVPLRGNVQTRLDKLQRGEQGMQGIVLALAGLKRLGLPAEPGFIVEPEEMMPCAGQGAVGIETRREDQEALSIFNRINHFETLLCVKAERAALAVLDGSCHTPIGALARLEKDKMKLRVCVAALDGSRIFEEQAQMDVKDAAAAEKFGRLTGEKLKARLPAGFLD